MSSDPALRVGVVGCGYWGSKHVRALSSLEAVRKVLLIDSNQGRARTLSRSFANVAARPSLRAALDELDAVVIATPPSTHTELALEAIAAGKHVLVEKPLAQNVRDATSIVRAAEAAGVVLMAGHTFEYHSAVWRLRDMVRDGSLGELYYVDTARLNLGLYQHDVNVIFDLAPHDVSILNHVLASRPVSVECWASRHAHSRLEDIAYIRLHYEQPRLVANIHVSWLDPCKVRRLTMVGSKTMVIFDDLASEERIRIHHKAVSQPMDDRDLTQPPMSYQYGEVVAPHLVLNEPLVVEESHFIDCIRSGRKPTSDGNSGLAVVEVLEAAQRSHEERRPVDIAEIRFPPSDQPARLEDESRHPVVPTALQAAR
jgi:predicted dehydrogenase